MIPSRVIERAIKRLNIGWMPKDDRGQAKTAAGSIVSYQHPDAIQFTATSAVLRALFELTDKPAIECEQLWSRTMDPLKDKYGNGHWSTFYDFMHNMTKEECIAFYQARLKELRNYD